MAEAALTHVSWYRGSSIGDQLAFLRHRHASHSGLGSGATNDSWREPASNPAIWAKAKSKKIRNQLPNGKPSWREKIVGPLFPTLVALVLIVSRDQK
jgi:hypothetical protein